MPSHFLTSNCLNRSILFEGRKNFDKPLLFILPGQHCRSLFQVLFPRAPQILVAKHLLDYHRQIFGIERCCNLADAIRAYYGSHFGQCTHQHRNTGLNIVEQLIGQCIEVIQPQRLLDRKSVV